MTDLHYPLNEYSDNWNPTGGFTVPKSDLPWGGSDDDVIVTSDDEVQE